ncbi:HAD family hydrolase [Halalkalibacter alkalisediminis]|uniref:HAD family hydrolase n=1 Tax=Halalkalibacter alkalisediminis TaxID=935616 RepID=A0ABV6NJH0_9BACI|nr:HAD family hydrolase [Halalkalibacter alkalisediminis]
MLAKALLFDLDGTLLPMDTDQFIKHYIAELAKRMESLMDPNEFVKALLTGTAAMIKNRESTKTNEQVFEETFLPLTSLQKEEIWPVLDDFYESIFPTFSHLTKPTKLAKQVVEEAIKQGYKVAVATNPLFPKSAIYHRLTWAEIDELPFELVTVYENMAFTKPHQEYYQEISNRLSVTPEECMMIGNDKQEDMVASSIGMKTFLVEGHVIDRGEPSFLIDDYGTLEDLYNKLKKQEGLFSK